jgi:hypothetical protein
MRRYIALAVVGAAVLGLALFGGRLLLPETLAKSSQPTGAPGLEKAFSGGWLMNVHEPAGTAEVHLGLGAGGLLVINATPTPNGPFNTTGIGSWKPIGPRELVGTLMCFVRDYSQNLICYEVGKLSMTLSDDGNRLEGDGLILIYFPGQDPLDPEEEPGFEIPVPIDARRITAE